MTSRVWGNLHGYSKGKPGGLGVVQKLRGQDEVGRWSKNASFCPRLG